MSLKCEPFSKQESLEKDQRITWELEDKWKKEKAARDACQVLLLYYSTRNSQHCA